MRRLVIFGTGSFAEVAHFMFTNDSDYVVDAFTVHEKYIERDSVMGCPIVPFERLGEKYPSTSHEVFVAVGYKNLNRLRADIVHQCRQRGYKLATYVSSKSSFWDAKIGENCFIFEDNTIQPFVEIGDNTIMWSGNHVGHHSTIGSHCFITSHVVISGHVKVGDYCFIGVNATTRDSIEIGEACIIGAGALIMKSTKPREVYISPRTKADSRSSDEIEM